MVGDLATKLYLTLATPRTAACQVPLSIGFPRQEYWSGLSCASPGDLPYPGIETAPLMSPTLASGFFTLVPPGKPKWLSTHYVPNNYPVFMSLL